MGITSVHVGHVGHVYLSSRDDLNMQQNYAMVHVILLPKSPKLCPAFGTRSLLTPAVQYGRFKVHHPFAIFVAGKPRIHRFCVHSCLNLRVRKAGGLANAAIVVPLSTVNKDVRCGTAATAVTTVQC